jgi:hypothetical protein
MVELRDGSAWRIWPSDIPKTLQWLPTTEIDIADIEDEICSHASAFDWACSGRAETEASIPPSGVAAAQPARRQRRTAATGQYALALITRTRDPFERSTSVCWASSTT